MCREEGQEAEEEKEEDAVTEENKFHRWLLFGWELNHVIRGFGLGEREVGTPIGDCVTGLYTPPRFPWQASKESIYTATITTTIRCNDTTPTSKKNNIRHLLAHTYLHWRITISFTLTLSFLFLMR